MSQPNRKPDAAQEPVICACLAWYAETPETLERCVMSLAGVADVLVALDGRWAGMPGATDRSSTQEWRAVKRAAAAAEIKLHVSAAGAPFESQVAKRAELMRRGARTGATWLLVIDGDESLACPDPAAFRAAALAVETDVAFVNMHTAGREAKQVDRGVRRLYRAATGVTCATAHNGYVTTDGRWLGGDPHKVTVEEAVRDLEPLLTINHHTDARDKQRMGDAQTYRIARRRTRIEEWV